MKRHQLLRLSALLALVTIGCSGGCGCDGMTPVPGGFPVEERLPSAVAVKLSKGAFDMLEESLAPLMEDAVGGQLGAGVPCTDATQSIQPVQFLPPYDVRIFVCDVDDDQACTPADDDPALRVDQPGHGPLCGMEAQLTGVSLRPTQANVSAPVDLEIVLQMQINTGRIPLVIHNPCTLRCAIEIDTDRHAPPYIPVTARVRFRLDPTRGDILAFDVFMDDLMAQLDERELQFHNEGGGCGFGCSILNIDFVKRMLFDRIQGMVEEQITGIVDGFRCAPCEGGCPTGSACNSEVGVCYDTDANGDFLPDGSCPAAFLGMEGRMQLAAVLGDFGAPPNAGLDLSVVAGGRDPETDRPTHRVENQGLVVGLMGGSRSVAMGGADGSGDRVPAHSRCVPLTEWEERPPQSTLNFDEEAQSATSGTPVGDYHLAFGIGDNFLDKLFFDLWDAGALCLNIGTETVDLLSTGLFSTFLPSLDVLTDGKDVPLQISLRPSTPPHVVIGKGTTKPGPDGGVIPDDPLLTIAMEGLHMDFYALLEERWSRLFTLTTDVRIPFSLDIDTANGTITPALGALDALLSNTRAANSEMLSEDPAALASLIETLMGLIQPALGGGLGPIDLPSGGDGFGLDIQALRGAVKYTQGAGYEYLAGFASLQLDALPFPATNVLAAEARLVDSVIPPVEAVVGGAIPTAVIEARGLGATPNDFRGHEYAFRVNGGPWSSWRAGGRLEVAKPVMRLQGTHRIEVRVREAGVPESTSTPAAIDFVVDHAAPRLTLELDHATRSVKSVASDAVAAVNELSFRYRANDGAWSAWGPARVFTLEELGANPALEAEVRDPSGHLAAARFGHVSVSTTTSTSTSGSQTSVQAGCTHAAVSLLSLLGLLALRRNRRADRHHRR